MILEKVDKIPKDIKNYKFSIFNLYLDFENDAVGIYNTLHDSAVIINKEMFQKIQEKSGKIDTESLNVLLAHKMVFHHSFNEKIYFRYYINKLKYSPRYASLILSLTSDCNLCCEYCFEGKNKEKHYMSSEIALKVIEFIGDTYHKHSSLKNLYVAFFGGEPFLNRNVMTQICDKLSKITHLSKIINFTLTSNLTLLTKKDIEVIKKYHFTNVQVSIDGGKEYHDSRRSLKSGKGTFDLIIDNIQRLIENNIKVMLFLNFDKSNADSYDVLIPFIKKNLPYKKIVFFLNPITKSLCNTDCQMPFMNKKEEIETFLKLYKKAKLSGLNVQAFGLRDMLCISTSDASYIINPKGHLYKCGMMLDQKEYCVGNVFSTPPFENLNYEMIVEDFWRSCLDSSCAYLPICGGGCRAQALLNEGDLKSIDCQRNDYFKAIYNRVLRDHFKELT